jgi:hypothetical protein
MAATVVVGAGDESPESRRRSHEKALWPSRVRASSDSVRGCSTVSNGLNFTLSQYIRHPVSGAPPKM